MQALLVNSVEYVNSSVNMKVNILRKEYATFPNLSNFDFKKSWDWLSLSNQFIGFHKCLINKIMSNDL